MDTERFKNYSQIQYYAQPDDLDDYVIPTFPQVTESQNALSLPALEAITQTTQIDAIVNDKDEQNDSSKSLRSNGSSKVARSWSIASFEAVQNDHEYHTPPTDYSVENTAFSTESYNETSLVSRFKHFVHDYCFNPLLFIHIEIPDQTLVILHAINNQIDMYILNQSLCTPEQEIASFKVIMLPIFGHMIDWLQIANLKSWLEIH